MMLETADISNPSVIAMVRQLEVLKGMLTTSVPLIPQAMVDLHKNMQAHEELAHLLDDEGIAMLVQIHQRHKGLIIVQMTAAKQKAEANKRTKINVNNILEL